MRLGRYKLFFLLGTFLTISNSHGYSTKNWIQQNRVVVDQREQFFSGREKDIRVILQGLQGNDGDIRKRAISLLAEFGPNNKDSIPFLEQALEKNKDVFVRTPIAATIKRIDPSRKDMIEVLIQEMKRESGTVAYVPADALVEFGSEAAPYLVQALSYHNLDSLTSIVGKESPNYSLYYCQAAAYALSKLTLLAVPDLVKGLNDSNPRIRAGSASSLRDIGAEAKDAIPALLGRLNDDDQFVRSRIYLALAQVGKGDEQVRSALEHQHRKYLLRLFYTGKFLLMPISWDGFSDESIEIGKAIAEFNVTDLQPTQAEMNELMPSIKDFAENRMRAYVANKIGSPTEAQALLFKECNITHVKLSPTKTTAKVSYFVSYKLQTPNWTVLTPTIQFKKMGDGQWKPDGN